MSLQRTALTLQPSGQVSLISAVPSLLQRTRSLPLQRSDWFALQIELEASDPPLSGKGTSAGRGNPHAPPIMKTTTSKTHNFIVKFITDTHMLVRPRRPFG